MRCRDCIIIKYCKLTNRYTKKDVFLIYRYTLISTLTGNFLVILPTIALRTNIQTGLQNNSEQMFMLSYKPNNYLKKKVYIPPSGDTEFEGKTSGDNELKGQNCRKIADA